MISTNASPYHEYALKRANEFLQLGKHHEAAECLYDFIKSKKNRTIISASETVMKKLLHVCVTHKMSKLAKDSLYSYRTLCHGVNIKSWEDIIRSFLQHIDEQLELVVRTSATSKNNFSFLNDGVTPENDTEHTIDENKQENDDSLVLLPCIKFSWDCYRFCLDLLRNCQGDKFYHFIAQKACHFCVSYIKRNELRKLCTILRLHFGHYQKRQGFSELNCTEIQMLYLETGMIQLDSAIKLEDWQDAFKILEDIHNIINIQKKFPNSKIISIYYDRLSFIFWQSNDLLYHASALLRCFVLTRDMKRNITGEDISMLSAKLVLAVLAIPLEYANPTVELITENNDSFMEKKHRLLIKLLDLPSKPSRKSLVRDIERSNILRDAPPEIYDIFKILEYNDDPLTLVDQLKHNFSIIQNWKTELGLEKYFGPIYKVSTVVLVLQLSTFYANVSFKKLISLAPPLEEYVLEALLVDIARKYNIQLRVDHNSECIHFDSQLNEINSQEELNYRKKDYFSNTNNYLAKVYSSLVQAVKILSPLEDFDAKLKVKDKLLTTYFQTNERLRQEMKDRKKKIDKFKEMIETIKAKKEEEDKKRAIDIQLKYEAAEKERLLRETEERNMLRRMKEQDELKKQILMEKMKKSEIGPLIEKYNLSDIDNLDPEKLFCKHIEFINKEKKEFSKRLKGQERAIYHLERAKRLEEIPLLELRYECESKTHRNEWEEFEKDRIFQICDHRRHMVFTKSRMRFMKEDIQVFIQMVQKNRKAQLETEMENFLTLLCHEREKRLKEREDKRKAQRRLAWVHHQKEKKASEKNAEVIQKRENAIPMDTIPVENQPCLKAVEGKIKILDRNLDDNFKEPFSKGVQMNQTVGFPSKILMRDPKQAIAKSPKLPIGLTKSVDLNKTSSPFVKQRNKEKGKTSEKVIESEQAPFQKCENESLIYGDRGDQTMFSACTKTSYQNNEEKHISKHHDRVYQRSFFNTSYLNKHEIKHPAELEGKFRLAPPSWRQTNLKNFASQKEILTNYAFQRRKGFSKFERSLYNNQKDEIEKYDKNHSCTPWAKLNRTKISESDNK